MVRSKKTTPMSPLVQSGSADGTGKVINLQAIRYQMMRAMFGGAANMRGAIGRLFGQGHNGKRDYYEVFGWDRNISSEQMWFKYTRGGIARRIVHSYPDATWGAPPTPDGGTKAWKDQWDELVENLALWTALHRLDRISQLGQYAVLLIGTDDGLDLSRPLNTSTATKITFLQPYSDRSAIISSWGTDPSKENFNLPEMYTIYPDRMLLEQQAMGGSAAGQMTHKPSRGSFQVHHSRVIHVSQSPLESDIFGVPLLWSVWNYLTDLDKITGGAAESYWLTGNRGMHANLDKDVDLEEEDEAALTAEIEEYQHGLRRFIRTRGVTVENLGTDVADPKGPFETNITLIAGSTAIPKRILLGSESGHNASTQDKGTWAERIEEYRTLTAEPGILKKFVAFCTGAGLLPTLSKTKKVSWVWPSAYRLSPLESAQRGNQRATAAANLSRALQATPNLAGRQEARGWLDLPEDDKGDILEIKEPKMGGFGDKEGDGGTETPGPSSGTTATPTSDANGQGDPV